MEIVYSGLKGTCKEYSFLLLTIPFSLTVFRHTFVGSHNDERIILLDGMRPFHGKTHLFPCEEPIKKSAVSTFRREFIPDDPLIRVVIVCVESIVIWSDVTRRKMLKEMNEGSFPSIGLSTSKMKHRLFVRAILRDKIMVEERNNIEELGRIRKTIRVNLDSLLQLIDIDEFNKRELGKSSFMKIFTVNLSIASKSERVIVDKIVNLVVIFDRKKVMCISPLFDTILSEITQQEGARERVKVSNEMVVHIFDEILNRSTLRFASFVFTMMVKDEIKIVRTIDSLRFVVFEKDMEMDIAVFVFFPGNNSIFNILFFLNTTTNFREVNKFILRNLRKSKKEFLCFHLKDSFCWLQF